MKLKFQIPTVKNETLILITGFIWTSVGLMLMLRAYSWIELLTVNQLIISVSIGLLAGTIKILFVFNKSSKHNINRIMNLNPEKVNIFAFHTFKFYLLIALMIGGGIFLRTLEFIPKYAILPIYLGVGTAMLISSFRYYIYYYNCKKAKT